MYLLLFARSFILNSMQYCLTCDTVKAKQRADRSRSPESVEGRFYEQEGMGEERAGLVLKREASWQIYAQNRKTVF